LPKYTIVSRTSHAVLAFCFKVYYEEAKLERPLLTSTLLAVVNEVGGLVEGCAGGRSSIASIEAHL